MHLQLRFSNAIVFSKRLQSWLKLDIMEECICLLPGHTIINPSEKSSRVIPYYNAIQFHITIIPVFLLLRSSALRASPEEALLALQSQAGPFQQQKTNEVGSRGSYGNGPLAGPLAYLSSLSFPEAAGLIRSRA